MPGTQGLCSAEVAIRRPFASGCRSAATVRRQIGDEVDAIFFAASSGRSFACEATRSEFRERWLGRYLALWPGEFFVASAPDGRAIGYLAGFIGDAARESAFDDIVYFREFADLSASYPAHLHVNVDEQWRSRGIGEKLVQAFCAHARAAGAPGVQVVTGEASRNVGFYQRLGFLGLGSGVSPWSGMPILFLGMRL